VKDIEKKVRERVAMMRKPGGNAFSGGRAKAVSVEF
jgi:hypothetical protein